MEYSEGLTKMNIIPAFQNVALIVMNKLTIPLVYKIDNEFVLPKTFYENDNDNPKENIQNSSDCYCQLL